MSMTTLIKMKLHDNISYTEKSIGQAEILNNRWKIVDKQNLHDNSR